MAAFIQTSNCSRLLKDDGSFNSNKQVDAKISGTSFTLTSTQPGIRAAVFDLHPVTKHKNWQSTSFIWRSITAKNQCCTSTVKMGSTLLMLGVSFSYGFHNFLLHKHLATLVHATMNLVGKNVHKNQKWRFAILEIAIFLLKVLIGQGESCNVAN